MQKPKNDRPLKCPFNGKPVVKVCHECMLYLAIRQGDGKDVWDCAFAMMPVLHSHLTATMAHGLDGVQKAQESFRNEVVKANRQAVNVIAATAHSRANGALTVIED